MAEILNQPMIICYLKFFYILTNSFAKINFGTRGKEVHTDIEA